MKRLSGIFSGPPKGVKGVEGLGDSAKAMERIARDLL
jgi:hypothetical protein